MLFFVIPLKLPKRFLQTRFEKARSITPGVEDNALSVKAAHAIQSTPNLTCIA